LARFIAEHSPEHIEWCGAIFLAPPHVSGSESAHPKAELGDAAHKCARLCKVVQTSSDLLMESQNYPTIEMKTYVA
jgi:hypothetical protein